jgi:hypothetical protein
MFKLSAFHMRGKSIMGKFFKRYRKMEPTIARRLTEEDYQRYQGQIQTLEGAYAFQVGDYLARDSKGMWPIERTTIHKRFYRISEPDAEGWAAYQALDIREAVQMDDSFTIDGLAGKKGDYLVRSTWGGIGKPVDREIFEATYAPIEQ